MYRRPKFLELLLEIRREMALEADYDVDLFVENTRHGNRPRIDKQLVDSEAPVEPTTPNPDMASTGGGRNQIIRKP